MRLLLVPALLLALSACTVDQQEAVPVTALAPASLAVDMPSLQAANMWLAAHPDYDQAVDETLENAWIDATDVPADQAQDWAQFLGYRDTVRMLSYAALKTNPALTPLELRRALRETAGDVLQGMFGANLFDAI